MSEAKILIVEDEGIEALDLQQRLISLGYPAPDIAICGEEAVQKAQESAPDLVLMDIMLHGEIDGVAAAERIQARFDIPIIYLTAYTDEVTLQRAKVTEPYGYLVKPYKERELHITIDVALYKHRMERKLRENEKWLATTLRCIGDAVIATDKEGRITFMNAVAERLLGWKLEETFNRKLTEVFNIINRDTRREVENPVSRVIREGTVVGLANHTRLIARDGAEIPIDDSAAPIKDDKGNIIGVVLVFRDVTERERALEAIHRARDELEARVRERTAELAKANGIQTMVNSLLHFSLEKIPQEELLKRALELVTSNPWIAAEPRGCIFLVDDESQHLLMKAHKGLPDSIQKGCASVPIGRCICGLAALQKRVVYCECSDGEHEMAGAGLPPHAHYLVPILFEGKLLGLIGLYLKEKRGANREDETALEAIASAVAGIIVRERGEQALQESENRLRHLSSELLNAQERERKRIARELHDSIVSSLSAVNLSIEGFLAHEKRNKPVAEMLHTLTSIVQRATAEIRRIMADLRPSILDDLGVSAAMDWLCREFQKLYPYIRVELLAETGEGEVSDALKTAIFRISQEALNNVAKYSRADSVKVSLKKGPGRIELLIRDSGHGFDPQKVFSMAGPRKGFGLISMRERAELLGGSFTLESAEGAGTAIQAVWPLEEGESPAGEDQAPAGPRNGVCLKTLLVEDNTAFRQSFRAGLQARFPSMMIEEAADGNEAIRKVHAFLPHLIFMDIHLPGKNGLQLTREIRSSHPGTFIIVVTGQDTPEYRKAAAESGAARFIGKDTLSWRDIEEAVSSLPIR